jgi:hypothetical protein
MTTKPYSRRNSRQVEAHEVDKLERGRWVWQEGEVPEMVVKVSGSDKGQTAYAAYERYWPDGGLVCMTSCLSVVLALISLCDAKWGAPFV